MGEIQEATVDDAPEILALQKQAYLSEAKLAGDYTIQPLTQRLEELEKEFEDHFILKYLEDGKICGSVRASQQDETCYISKLMVDPAFQNKGIGKALMEEIESRCHSRRYELFTGSLSVKNISFYKNLGYREFKRKKLDREATVFVFMEK